MPIDDDDRPRPTVSHQIGQDLSLLSARELEARMALLAGEIERLKAALEARQATRNAADALFKS